MKFLKALLFCRHGHIATPMRMADPRYSNASAFCMRCGGYLYGKWK